MKNLKHNTTLKKGILAKGFAILLISMFVFSNIQITAANGNDDLDRNKSGQNVILTFGDTSEEKMAIETLQENFPDSMVISYINGFRDLSVIKDIANIYVVGHGLEEGIRAKNEIVSYESINSYLSELKPQGIFYLACNSFDASSKLQGVKSFGFQGQIEPKLGAMLLSYMTGSNRVTVTSLFDRVVKILRNPSDFSTLKIEDGGGGGGGGGSTAYFGPNEQKGWATFILHVLAIAIFTATYAVASGYFYTAAWNFIKDAPLLILTTLVGDLILIVLSADVTRLFGILGTIWDALFGFSGEVLALIPWWYYPVVAAAVVVDLAFSTLSIWAKATIIMIALTAVIGLQYPYYVRDLNDPDDTYEPL